MKVYLLEQPKKYQIIKQRMKTITSNSHIFELRMEDWKYEMPPFVRTTAVNPDDSPLECRKNSEIIRPFWSNTTVAKIHLENSFHNVEWIVAKIQPSANKAVNNYSAFFGGLVPSFCSNRGECCLRFEVFIEAELLVYLLSDPFVVGSKKPKDPTLIFQNAIFDYQRNTDKKIDIERNFDSYAQLPNLTRASSRSVTKNNNNNNDKTIVMHASKGKGKVDLISHPPSFAAPIFVESPKSGPSTSPTSSVSPMNATATNGEHKRLVSSLSNRNLGLQDSGNKIQLENLLLEQNNLFLTKQNEDLMRQLVLQTQQQIEITNNSINTLGRLEMQYKSIMQSITGIFNTDKDEMEINTDMKIDEDTE